MDCPCTVGYTMVDYIPQTIAAPEPRGVCLSSSQSSRHATVVGVLELVVAAAGLARFVPSHPALAHGLTFPTKRYFARANVCDHLSSNHSASRYFSSHIVPIHGIIVIAYRIVEIRVKTPLKMNRRIQSEWLDKKRNPKLLFRF